MEQVTNYSRNSDETLGQLSKTELYVIHRAFRSRTLYNVSLSFTTYLLSDFEKLF